MYKISAFRKEPIHRISYEIEDENKDGIPDLMVKFDRAVVQAILEVGEVESLSIIGELNGGTTFGGTDTVRVIKEE